jgi:hypothetical protein
LRESWLMSTPARKIPAPRIARSVTLNFMGDWGRANLHRADACRTPIPLHPGAERYFREAGHLD